MRWLFRWFQRPLLSLLCVKYQFPKKTWESTNSPKHEMQVESLSFTFPCSKPQKCGKEMQNDEDGATLHLLAWQHAVKVKERMWPQVKETLSVSGAGEVVHFVRPPTAPPWGVFLMSELFQTDNAANTSHSDWRGALRCESSHDFSFFTKRHLLLPVCTIASAVLWISSKEDFFLSTCSVCFYVPVYFLGKVAFRSW